MEKFQRYKAETGKSSKTKINSPNKTKQINIPLNHNKINFIRENIENLSISEIRSEISLVIIALLKILILINVGESKKICKDTLKYILWIGSA